jgi:hypothetical protein
MITNFINPYSKFSNDEERWHFSSFEHLDFSKSFAPHTTYRVSKLTEYAQPDLYQYDINAHGFRSADFHEDTEIITLGCSHTFGVGVPTELIWPNVVKELTGVQDVINLGRPGSSIAHQIRWLTNYIRIFGPPKMVLANFPELNRYEYIDEKGVLKFGSTEKGYEDNSLTEYQAFTQSIDAINTLEAICAINRIVLRWQMWADTTQYLEKKIAEVFSKYVQNKYTLNFLTVENPRLDLSSNEIVGEYAKDAYWSGCCDDLKNKSKGCFNYGYDRYVVPKKYLDEDFVNSAKLEELRETTVSFINGRLEAHFGSHAHYHWAKNLVDSF